MLSSACSTFNKNVLEEKIFIKQRVCFHYKSCLHRMYSLQELFTLHVFITRVVYKIVYPNSDPARARHMAGANNKSRLKSQEQVEVPRECWSAGSSQ